MMFSWQIGLLNAYFRRDLIFSKDCDKASKLLAQTVLRQISSSHQIPLIEFGSSIPADPVEINKVFQDFYAALYSSDHDTTSPDFDSFFDRLDIPLIEQEVAIGGNTYYWRA